MCKTLNCDVLTFRSTCSSRIETVRCGELGAKDRARFGCEAVRHYQSRQHPVDQNALRAIGVYLKGGWEAIGSCEQRAVGLNPWRYEQATQAAFFSAMLAVLERISGDGLVEQGDNLLLGQDALAHQSLGEQAGEVNEMLK